MIWRQKTEAYQNMKQALYLLMKFLVINWNIQFRALPKLGYDNNGENMMKPWYLLQRGIKKIIKEIQDF